MDGGGAASPEVGVAGVSDYDGPGDALGEMRDGDSGSKRPEVRSRFSEAEGNREKMVVFRVMRPK